MAKPVIVVLDGSVTVPERNPKDFDSASALDGTETFPLYQAAWRKLSLSSIKDWLSSFFAAADHTHAAGAGDLTGPAGAIAGNIAVFSGTTGKIVADSGLQPTDFMPADWTPDLSAYSTTAAATLLYKPAGYSPSKADVEGVLTGEVSSHSHAASGGVTAGFAVAMGVAL